MKKLLLFLSVALLGWTCSTEVDLLDDWKETTVVYGLLDQSQAKQYIRIQKAFLGPDNALTMAQVYDSINYINQLEVFIQETDESGNIYNTFQLQPDTLPKDPGMFAGPSQVIYSFDTPQGTLNSNRLYKLTVKNTATGNSVYAITNLVETTSSGVFNLILPSTSSPTVSFTPTSTQPLFTMKWKAAPSAHLYQPTITFYYTEYYLNGDSATKATQPWTLSIIEPAASALSSDQSLEFDKIAFLRFIGSAIADDPNVVKRRAAYVVFDVYAGNEELKNYIDINGASSSISQDHPLYTNIHNSDPNLAAYGLFASRYRTRKLPSFTDYSFLLANSTIDGQSTYLGLTQSEYTCHLKFMKTDGTVPGCP